MNKKSFDELHGHQGGYEKLLKMMEELKSLKQISDNFGVCNNAVRLWCKDLFGKNYDPRKIRRQIILNEMVDFAKKNGKEEFQKKYRNKTSHYYYIALSKCYANKIF